MREDKGGWLGCKLRTISHWSIGRVGFSIVAKPCTVLYHGKHSWIQILLLLVLKINIDRASKRGFSTIMVVLYGNDTTRLVDPFSGAPGDISPSL